MSEEIDVLKVVCHRLEQADVPYVLTGSFAANFYATPRMTRDIDIVIATFKSDVNKLFQLFQNDFYINMGSISTAIEHEGMFNIIHTDLALKIDFIIRKNSDYRNIEFQRRHRVQIGNAPIWIVAPEDLIISKLFWAKESLSEMQLNDVRNLLVARKNLDKEYIHKWVQALELHDLYDKVKQNA